LTAVLSMHVPVFHGVGVEAILALSKTRRRSHRRKRVVEAEGVKRCVSCGTEPPVLNEDTHLLSKRGWRLTRTIGEDGRVTLEWRCPRCWTRHRQMKTVTNKGER
jgi:hypothetical protein